MGSLEMGKLLFFFCLFVSTLLFFFDRPSTFQLLFSKLRRLSQFVPLVLIPDVLFESFHDIWVQSPGTAIRAT
jgi:hypothetical protein